MLDVQGEGVVAEGQERGGEASLDELVEEGKTVSAGLVEISCCGTFSASKSCVTGMSRQ